jgi:hypothetical protein
MINLDKNWGLSLRFLRPESAEYRERLKDEIKFLVRLKELHKYFKNLKDIKNQAL